MKSLSFLTLFLMFWVSALAQTSKTVQVTTAGTLNALISESETKTLLTLTVTGNIDTRDIAFIRDNIKYVSSLDLMGASIKPYTGTIGTNTGILSSYPANELPMYSFYNPFLKTYKSSLTSIKLPTSLVSIGELAFYFCWNLTGQLSIPASVTSISDYAFYGCYALTSFSVSNANSRYSSSIGVLFSKHQDTLLIFPNAKPGNYVIPSTVKRIHPSAFENSYNLTSVTIPTSVTSIGSYAFCNCSGITGDLSLSSSVTTLEEGAFYACYNLTGTVSIPSTLTALGAYGFFGSNSIQSFSVNASNPAYASNNGMLYSKNLDTLFICPGAKSGSVTIPSTVKVIGSHAFYNCESVTGTINIPANIDYIGYYAFYGCKNITSYTTDNSNIYFRTVDGVLYSKNLDRILVCPSTKTGAYNTPSTIKYIDPCAFSFCTSLTGHIHIPASLEYLGEFAFYGCSTIAGFTVDQENPYVSARDGLLFNKNMDSVYICPLSKSGAYDLPEGVRFIGLFAFDGCSGLTAINLPETVEELGDYAFENCTGITGMTIPSSVIKLGSGVFYNCSNLQQLTVKLPLPPVVDYYFLELVDKASCQLNVPINMGVLYRNAPYWEDFTTINETVVGTAKQSAEGQSIRMYRNPGGLVIEGLRIGQFIDVYSINGTRVIRRKIPDQHLNLQLPHKGVYLIKTDGTTLKGIY